MATVIASNQLDFEFIKGRIIEYMKQQKEFQDYDFEASGLSAIADVLAFNTHQNALLGNFAINESFLQTAQLRSSLVNLALNFAYVPRSKTAATAYINLSLNLTAAAVKPELINLPTGTEFTTTLDDVTYTFRTTEEYIARIDQAGLGIYTFEDEEGNLAIPIKEGVEKTKTFLVNTALERQIYVIPDTSLDLTTLKVRVYEDEGDTAGVSYLPPAQITGFGEDTRLYLPLETYNGFYELNFGDGTITGAAPLPGNIIRARYISSNGAAANGASTFTPETSVRVNNTDYNLIATTVTKSTLGAEKETTESIRLNAPLNYLAQSRLVTPSDYIAVISNALPGIKSVNAWGGEDNVPEPKFGKVIISIIYEADLDAAAKERLETQILSELTSNLSIASIGAEIVEPDYTYLNLLTTVKYNNAATDLSRRGLELKIRNGIASYFNANFGEFNKIFRKSKLLSTIDSLDPSILSSKVGIVMENRFTPAFNAISLRFITADYALSFLNPLASPKADSPVITSDNFVFKGRTCSIKNVIGENNSTKLQVIDTSGNVVVSDIGSYNPATGVVRLTGFTLTSISSGESYVRIQGVPADDANIKPLRNFIIDLNINTVVAQTDTNTANATFGQE